MLVLRQKHQQAPGNADLRRQACALGANRVFDDLHQQGLTFEHLFFDGHHGCRLTFFGVGVARSHAAHQIGYVQKCSTLQTDVNEGRLHARQHPRDFAEVHITHQAALKAALDVQLLHRASFHDGHTRLLGRPVDEDVLLHKGSALKVKP